VIQLKRPKKEKTIVSDSKVSDDIITEEENLDTYDINPITKKALRDNGIKKLFPIQYKTFNLGYAGKDVIGRAQTGTGKTLAFALPIIEHLLKKKNLSPRGRAPKVLVLSPTRELAQQIAQSFYDVMPTHLKITCIYGGSSYTPQERDLHNGVDIVVGTPGRVNDHIEKGRLRMDEIDHVVLDETDEMLNHGFAEKVEAILSYIPAEKDRQTFLFSATLPDWVKKVASTYLKKDHVTVDLIGNSKLKVGANITHYGIVVDGGTKRNPGPLVAQLISTYAPKGKTIVFVEMKVQASELARDESLRNISQQIHGDLNQASRNSALDAFVSNQCSVLIATDVAARGLDIPNVDLVIQIGNPKTVETYTHRSGRTARAGKLGLALLIVVNLSELVQIERSLGIKFKIATLANNQDRTDQYIEEVQSQLKKVDQKSVTMFLKTAKRMIKKDGAEVALATALAAIANVDTRDKSSFSIVTGTCNVTSLYCNTQDETEIVNELKKIIDRPIRHEIFMCYKEGAVLDVPSEYASKLVNQSIFSTLDEVPILQHRSSFGRSNGFSGGRGGSYRAKSSGGYGGGSYRAKSSGGYGGGGYGR